MEIPENVIKVLESLYLQGSAYVSYSSESSYTFQLSQGIRQGSILAPYLFNIYMSELLSKIEDLKVGTKIGPTFTGITAYADDIILMRSTLSGLQNIIDCCITYGIRHKIKFNSSKTEFLISGISHINNPYIYIDGIRVYPKK